MRPRCVRPRKLRRPGASRGAWTVLSCRHYGSRRHALSRSFVSVSPGPSRSQSRSGFFSRSKLGPSWDQTIRSQLGPNFTREKKPYSARAGLGPKKQRGRSFDYLQCMHAQARAHERGGRIYGEPMLLCLVF
jgi:hypothetical protein